MERHDVRLHTVRIAMLVPNREPYASRGVQRLYLLSRQRVEHRASTACTLGRFSRWMIAWCVSACRTTLERVILILRDSVSG